MQENKKIRYHALKHLPFSRVGNMQHIPTKPAYPLRPKRLNSTTQNLRALKYIFQEPEKTQVKAWTEKEGRGGGKFNSRDLHMDQHMNWLFNTLKHTKSPIIYNTIQ